jgi:CTP synthase
MPEISKTHMGGTMRLGLRPTVFENGTEEWSKARKLYAGKEKIWERHRHRYGRVSLYYPVRLIRRRRYEVNPEWVERLEASGLSFSGRDEKGERMQVLELRG